MNLKVFPPEYGSHLRKYYLQKDKCYLLFFHNTIIASFEQSHQPNYEFLTSEPMQLNPNCPGKDSVYVLNYSWTLSRLLQVFPYCHARTSGLLLHEAEIVGAWRVCSYFNWPFTCSCSYLNSLINPLPSGFCFCQCPLTIVRFFNEVPVAKPTVKCHSCLLISSVAFPAGERSLLSLSSMAPHVCGFPLTFLASFAH